MPLPIQLRIEALSDGAWGVALGSPNTQPVRGRLEPASVEELRDRVAELLGPGQLPVVLLRGADADRTQCEERVGRALSRVLHATPQLTGEMAFQLGAARERGERVVLVVDSPDPGIRALPWELIAMGSGEPIESSGAAVVARLSRGRSRGERPAGAGLSVLSWCPTREETHSAALLAHLDRIAGDLGLGVVQRLEEGVDPEVWARPDGAAVLHVVCHGRRTEEAFELLLGEEGNMAPGTAQHLLTQALPSCDLVVLHVCEGGSATPEETEGLVGRLIAAGAPACLAPPERLSMEASKAFLRGLYPALVRESSLAAAVAAGRREVRGLAMPHPDSRWHNQCFFVGDLAELARPALVKQTWLPGGWPRPSREVAALLEQAHAMAKGTSAGFVGLEHLAMALSRTAYSAPGLDRLRYQLGLRREVFRDFLASFVPASRREPAWEGTPRLRRYGEQLQAGFTLLDLWGVIGADEGHILHEVLPFSLGVRSSDSTESFSLLDRTLHSGEWDLRMEEPGPPETLEVVGGPEDGRRVRMAPGERLGRYSHRTEVQHPLYKDTHLVDRGLSREHLRWRGPGRVELLKRGRGLIRGRQREELEAGEHALNRGDLLKLSRGTWLRAISDEG